MNSEQSIDELARLGEWLAAGHKTALSTVVSTWGSSPRPVGSHLVIDESGVFFGSVSGGCIEGAVVAAALEVIDCGDPRVLEFGVSDEEAWDVGLSCGGAIRIYVERVQ
jgi:xanthine/CO dehydrogenase XdhC/CoxF family maturation factor